MSTFRGKIQEIPDISVDRFDKENLESEAFFLSHCHTDHMVGLSNPDFHALLISSNRYLFASKISCIIVSKMYPTIKDNLRELSMYQPTFVRLKNVNLSVIPMPAGHCPGSVMFLFENDKHILYTGDIRINVNDLKKLKNLYDAFGNLKTIHKVYLDTTFFLKSYLKFPKREESLDELCKIISPWIELGKDFNIELQTSARYGYEFLFMEIYKRFGIPIHVNSDMYDFYSLIPDLDKAVTLDKISTQIHCHCGPRFRSICDVCTVDNTKKIVVSAFRWKHETLEYGISEDNGDAVNFVCYSTHNSYEETLGVIEFLRPHEIEICVEPLKSSDQKELLDFVREYTAQHSISSSKSRNNFENSSKLFEVNRRKKLKVDRKEKCSTDSFGIFDSPPLLADTEPYSNPKIRSTTNSKEHIAKVSTCDNDVVTEQFDISVVTQSGTLMYRCSKQKSKTFLCFISTVFLLAFTIIITHSFQFN